jgi:hypothetical protein
VGEYRFDGLVVIGLPRLDCFGGTLCNVRRNRYNGGMSDRVLRIEMIDDQMAAILRAKSPAERLAIAHGMWAHAENMLCQILKQTGPVAPEAGIRLQVVRRLSHGAV